MMDVPAGIAGGDSQKKGNPGGSQGSFF